MARSFFARHKKLWFRKVRDYLSKFGYDLRQIHTIGAASIKPAQDLFFEASPLPIQPNGEIVFMTTARQSVKMLENALCSLRLASNRQTVRVFTTPKNLKIFRPLEEKYSCIIEPIPSFESDEDPGYLEYGPGHFRTAASFKWKCVQSALTRENTDYVVYSDIDVAFFRDIEPYMCEAVKHHAVGIQSEARSTYPPQYCTGFMFFRSDSVPFLEEIIRITSSNKDNEKAYDQVVFNEIVHGDSSLRSKVLTLPEAVFANGLQFPGFVGDSHPDLIHRLEPMLFHANYVSGLEAKVRMLKAMGGWVIED